MQLEALILDKDGVIFDSERIYARALTEALQVMGLPANPALVASFTGLDTESTFVRLREVLGKTVDTERLIHEWLSRKDKIYAHEGLPFIPGAAEIIRNAYEAGYPLALVTSDSLDQ